MGSITKYANRERLEVMRYIITITVLGLFSLLMANEARYSSQDVLENPAMYGGHLMALSYNEYVTMGYVFTVIGVGLLIGGVAKSLLLSQAKKSSGFLR